MLKGSSAALAAGVLLTTAACAPRGTDHSGDIHELSNIRQDYFVPPSAPDVYVETFARFCESWDGNADRLAQRLRASGYVETRNILAERRRPADNIRSFVSDDTRPAIVLVGGNTDSTTPQACSVTATARTGQQAHVARYMATSHPTAKVSKADDLHPSIERTWRSARHPPTLFYTQRLGQPSGLSRYTFVILQQKGPSSGPQLN